MSELILHHYDLSPFSEKIRLIFGLKGLPWRSVQVPRIMPKPDLVPLTGGYRRAPVMQIGANVYCDTQRVVAELERRHPEPTLYPGGTRGHHTALTLWADKILFWPAVRYVIGEYAEEVGQEFHADRAAMRGAEPNVEAVKAAAPGMRDQMHPHLAWLEDMLSDGRAHVLGDAVGLADFAAYHCVWFVRERDRTAPELDAYPKLLAWMDRMAALGHGERSAMDAKDALAIARDTDPSAPAETGDGPRLGKPVRVVSDDGVKPPVEGHLVAFTETEIAVRRTDSDVGDVIVHFPRLGYLV